MVRRRPAAARLVPTSTGGSRGAETCRFGHVSRAARCLLACERLPETPGCLASTPAAAGERAGTPGSATLCAGLRARSPRRASMARRSTAACSECSRHSGQPRQALWEGLQGQSGFLGRDGELSGTTTTSSPIGPPAAGLRGAPLDGRLLPTLPTASSASLLSLRPPPGACADRLASPALPTTAARTSARRPRRPRRARIARRSSGECQGGCGVQAASLRPPPTRRGAAVGAAAGLLRCGLHHRVLTASPTPPAARRCLALPCHRAKAHTHTHTNTHTLLIIGCVCVSMDALLRG